MTEIARIVCWITLISLLGVLPSCFFPYKEILINKADVALKVDSSWTRFKLVGFSDPNIHWPKSALPKSVLAHREKLNRVLSIDEHVYKVHIQFRTLESQAHLCSDIPASSTVSECKGPVTVSDKLDYKGFNSFYYVTKGIKGQFGEPYRTDLFVPVDDPKIEVHCGNRFNKEYCFVSAPINSDVGGKLFSQFEFQILKSEIPQTLPLVRMYQGIFKPYFVPTQFLFPEES